MGVDTSSPLIKIEVFLRAVFWVLSCLHCILPNYVVHCHVHFHADDYQLHLSYDLNSHNVAIGILNIDLESIRTWSTKHGLKLNTDKCSVLHVAMLQSLQNLQEDHV